MYVRISTKKIEFVKKIRETTSFMGSKQKVALLPSGDSYYTHMILPGMILNVTFTIRIVRTVRTVRTEDWKVREYY